jgi:hypothetical protein
VNQLANCYIGILDRDSLNLIFMADHSIIKRFVLFYRQQMKVVEQAVQLVIIL